MQYDEIETFNLGTGASICIELSNFKEDLNYANGDQFAVMVKQPGICLREIFYRPNCKDPVDILRITMTPDQAKAVIKGLKYQIKQIKSFEPKKRRRVIKHGE